MSESDEAYKGSLEGVPCPHAASMACGVCRCGDLIGVDLYDKDGNVLAHGHLDIQSAMDFAESYADAIEQIARSMGFNPEDDS